MLAGGLGPNFFLFAQKLMVFWASPVWFGAWPVWSGAWPVWSGAWKNRGVRKAPPGFMSAIKNWTIFGLGAQGAIFLEVQGSAIRTFSLADHMIPMALQTFSTANRRIPIKNP